MPVGAGGMTGSDRQGGWEWTVEARLAGCGAPPKSGPLAMLVWAKRKAQTMKGKRHTTEQKIRILRAADSGKVITSTRAKDQHSTWLSFRDPLRII